MKGSQNTSDSFPLEKIHRPKPKRLCPSNKNSRNSSTTTISSNSNSEKFVIERNIQSNLNEISIDEINKDFILFGQNLEDEECQNEIWNILNNSLKENLNDSSEIERSKNPFEKNMSYLNDAFFDNLINENKKDEVFINNL